MGNVFYVAITCSKKYFKMYFATKDAHKKEYLLKIDKATPRMLEQKHCPQDLLDAPNAIRYLYRTETNGQIGVDSNIFCFATTVR